MVSLLLGVCFTILISLFLGAAHGDDTVYVLNSDVDTQTTDNDKEMSKLLINMWTSYANNRYLIN